MKLPRLVALTPGDVERKQVGALVRTVSGALEAGLPGVLLREPRLLDGVWLELARELRDACDACGGAWLGIHDRAHLATEVRADALHLGFRSLAPSTLRAQFDGLPTLGLSTHAGEAPGASAADYLFFGPVCETPSKPSGSPGRRPATGFGALRDACSQAAVPVYALGGLRPEHVAPALDAGAHGVAVLSGIVGAPRPSEAVAEYLAALDAVPYRA